MLYQAFDYFGVKGQVIAESNDLEALLKEVRSMSCFGDVFIQCNMDNTRAWATSFAYEV